MTALRYLRLDFALLGGEAPFFIGSALRGAFGHSLKKVCCINPKEECEGCFASSTCLYWDFFEKREGAHGYRFCIDMPASSWSFGIYLYEEACDKAPYVISALDSAITTIGLGAKRQTPKIESVKANGADIYKNGRYDLKDSKPALFDPKTASKISKITLKTPLRLKSDGKMVKKEEITALSIALSAQRRYDELKGEGAKRRRHEYARENEKANLEFLDLERYSNRQKTKMGLGGYVGAIECADMKEEMATALRLGEIVGVGKSCVFGLGEIKLEEKE